MRLTWLKKLLRQSFTFFFLFFSVVVCCFAFCCCFMLLAARIATKDKLQLSKLASKNVFCFLYIFELLFFSLFLYFLFLFSFFLCHVYRMPSFTLQQQRQGKCISFFLSFFFFFAKKFVYATLVE